MKNNYRLKKVTLFKIFYKVFLSVLLIISLILFKNQIIVVNAQQENTLSLESIQYFKQGGNIFNAEGVMGTTDLNPLSLITNNIKRITINSQGFVGIGGTNPNYLLDVSGTARVDRLITPYAQTKTVAKSGGDYTTVQSAIDSITDASTSKKYLVLVYPGEYNETVVTKDYVDLKGTDRDSVRIYSSSTDVNVPIVKIYPNVIISDLTVENTAGAVSTAQGISDRGAGTVINSKIANCKVTGNYDAIYFQNSGDDVTIESSYIIGAYDGIGCAGGATCRLFNNIIKYNASYNGTSRGILAANSNTYLVAIGNNIDMYKGAETSGTLYGVQTITGANSYLIGNHIKLNHGKITEKAIAIEQSTTGTTSVSANTFDVITAKAGSALELSADKGGTLKLLNQSYNFLYISNTSNIVTADTRFNNVIINGNMGIGTNDPQAKLEVAGSLRLTPQSSANCNKGAIYYNSSDNHFYGCNGSWVRLDN